MADYTPTLGDFTELKPFRFWCQKVLPLVYDDSLSYYELLCKVVDYLNKTMEDVDTMHDDVVNLHAAYVQLQTYVNTYFDNLDVQEEINTKLDNMAGDGSLSALISPFIPDIVTDWMDEHITPTSPVIDDTLSITGAGADAKVTGDNFVSTYSASSIYVKNNYVLYNGKIYKCISDILTPELWNSSHWTPVAVGDEVANLEYAVSDNIGKSVYDFNSVNFNNITPADQCTYTYSPKTKTIVVRPLAAWSWLNTTLKASVKPLTRYCYRLSAVFSNSLNQNIQMTYRDSAGNKIGNNVMASRSMNIVTPENCVEVRIHIYVSLENTPSLSDSVTVQNLELTEYEQINEGLSIANSKRIIMIGDSYGEGYSPGDADAVGWCNLVRYYCGLTYGVDAYKSVHSGYGFANPNGTFLSLLNAIVPSVSSPETITDIIVCGGINDATTVQSSDIRNAIDTFMSTAKGFFPNATVHVGMIGRSRTIAIKNDLPRVLKDYQEAAKYSNGCYINNCEYILCDQRLLSSDNTHPTRSGYVEIGKHLANYVKGNGIDVIYGPVNIGLSRGSCNWQLQNEITTIYLSVNYEPDDNVVSSANFTTLSWLSGFPFNGYGEPDFGTGYVTIRQNVGGESVNTLMPIVIRFTDGALEWRVLSATPVTFENVYEADIRIGYLSYPSLQM